MTGFQLVRGMRPGFVPHGFDQPSGIGPPSRQITRGNIAEAALAQVISDKVEAAYRPGDALEKRLVLMQEWADFCVN